MQRLLPVWVLVLSSVGWGLTWWPIKYFSGQGLQGLNLVFIAFGAGVLGLLPIFARQYRQWVGSLRFLLLIALLGGFANLAFQLALYDGDVVRVMILFYLLPVWSVIGGRIILKERVDRRRVIAVVAALSGAFLILGGWQALLQAPSLVDLLAIASGMAFAMNNIAFRAVQSVPVASKVMAMFAGCLALTAMYVGVSPDMAVTTVSASTLGLAALYGMLWLAAITLGTQWGVTQLEAGRAAVIIVMELVVAVISSTLILGTSLSLIEMTGGLLVLIAALLEGARSDVEPANVFSQ